MRAAKESAALSGVDNIRFAALSAAEISQAMRGDREFFRLKEAGIELNDYSFGALVVDPPRAGYAPTVQISPFPPSLRGSTLMLMMSAAPPL